MVWDKDGCSFFFSHIDVQLYEDYLLKTLSFSIELLLNFCQNSLNIYVWVYFLVLYFAPLTHLCILTWISHCLDYCIKRLTVTQCLFSNLALFFQSLFVILSFHLQINFRISSIYNKYYKNFPTIKKNTSKLTKRVAKMAHNMPIYALPRFY